MDQRTSNGTLDFLWRRGEVAVSLSYFQIDRASHYLMGNILKSPLINAPSMPFFRLRTTLFQISVVEPSGKYRGSQTLGGAVTCLLFKVPPRSKHIDDLKTAGAFNKAMRTASNDDSKRKFLS